MSCFFQRNLYPPINTDTVVDIYNFWIRQLCSSKHATQTLPELIAPQKSTPGFGWAKQNPRRFSHGRNMHRKIHPWLEGCPVARWDTDFVRGASEGSDGTTVFGFRGSGRLKLDRWCFFFWRQQNFKVEKFGEVLCSERFGPGFGRWMMWGFGDSFFDGHSSQRALVVSGRFSPQKKGFTISRSLRCKIVCQTPFLRPVITSQMWKFSCLVLQGNNKLSIHRSCAFFDF